MEKKEKRNGIDENLFRACATYLLEIKLMFLKALYKYSKCQK